MLGSWEICVAGEKLLALPEKALLWPSESTLFVADVHLGKDASFQAAGIPIPLGPTSETLGRLSELLFKTKPRRLILLGDLWHAKAGRTIGLVREFADWRILHQEVEIVLVEGNHDAKAGPLPESADVIEVKEPYVVGPFALKHYPDPCPEGYVLGGHIHPGVVLTGRGRQSMSFPCFWFCDDFGVLPAFGSFTGCGKITPCVGQQVLIVAEGQVTPARISD